MKMAVDINRYTSTVFVSHQNFFLPVTPTRVHIFIACYINSAVN